MASATLKFNEKEIVIGEAVTTFGRTPENTVSFADNSNISRRHAEIEFRDGAFWLKELGSSNGTTVNGQKIEDEIMLQDGDFITLGNSVIVEFIEDETEEKPAEQNAAQTSAAAGTTSATVGDKSSKTSVMLGVTGAVCGLAVVFAAVAGYVALSNDGSSACTASARIVNPRNGDAISEETEVKVEVSDNDCVKKVILVLNRKAIHTFEDSPYTTTLNPDNYADLSDGGLYPLEVVLEDAEGNKIPQLTAVNLQFETKEIATPTPTPTIIAQNSPTPTPPGQQGKQLSLEETRTLTAGVMKKLQSTGAAYNISNPDFLQEVRKRTVEYSKGGYSQRASGYKDFINQAFVREKSLDPSIGYVLAMSRSQFNPARQGANEGLWQMSSDFVNVNAYNVVCTNFNLSDTTQECAARVTAFYVRDLIDAFDGDVVYAVAAFGKSAGEANGLKTSLGDNRTDFWKVLPDQNMREQVARFFAAAIVMENPQRFKLKDDRPISELYPVPAAQ